MHMADALLSQPVALSLWGGALLTGRACIRRLRRHPDPARVPLMGVLGAFVFAAQMVNFTIPATGSSGHLGGGLLLAILLGPEAAFLVIASVLTIQALFFADGGLMALGCNIVNLGVFPAFVAYPLLYRPIVELPFAAPPGRAAAPWRAAGPSRRRVLAGAVGAAVVGVALGALGVVVETTLSGISDLPFATFLALMLPVHLAIGVVEGLITAAVVLYVRQVQPELLHRRAAGRPLGGLALRRLLVALALAAALTGGVLAWFASAHPDGLEWSVRQLTGERALAGTGSPLAHAAAGLQRRFALLPDYDLPATGPTTAPPAAPAVAEPPPQAPWGTPKAGTSLAGLVGGGLTLLMAGGLGLALRWRS